VLGRLGQDALHSRAVAVGWPQGAIAPIREPASTGRHADHDPAGATVPGPGTATDGN